MERGRVVPLVPYLTEISLGRYLISLEQLLGTHGLKTTVPKPMPQLIIPGSFSRQGKEIATSTVWVIWFIFDDCIRMRWTAPKSVNFSPLTGRRARAPWCKHQGSTWWMCAWAEHQCLKSGLAEGEMPTPGTLWVNFYRWNSPSWRSSWTAQKLQSHSCISTSRYESTT